MKIQVDEKIEDIKRDVEIGRKLAEHLLATGTGTSVDPGDRVALAAENLKRAHEEFNAAVKALKDDCLR